MDIHELKCFAQAAKDGSYSVAAAKLCISQPALSKIIQRLEGELGTELFYTFQRRQRLTDAGELFLQKTIRIIDKYDGISEIVRPDKSVFHGQIFMGFPPIAGICYLSELIADFSREYPGIKICIKEAGSQRIIDEVESGTLDLGCVSAPVSEDLFDHARFVRDRFCLAVSSRHPLAQRDSVTLPELRNEMFIVSDASFSTNHAMRFMCREAGFDPRIALYSARWDFIVQMVRLNYGISFQPLSIFKRFFFPDIHLLDVDHPAMDHWLELITKKDSYTSREVNCLISFLMERMEKDPDASSLMSLVAKRID